MHIQNIRVRNWIRDRIEARPDDSQVDREAKLDILHALVEAESFEHFLHTKYVGQKRFSLEGGESLMVVLNALLNDCPKRGVKEIAMGMAHRGRLTVLANFLRKSFSVIFTEFSENFIPDHVGGDGDVKYHLGYKSTRTLDDGSEVAIRLSANPSHLEAVNPVVEGMARARQRILKDTGERSQVLPLLIHGDAAFAGQGMVAEVLNLSQLPGYKTGGTIHVIVNNQIGFTTLPADARSSAYATDVAKMIEAPIFHVNGDDPLAVAFVTRLALEFRQQFHRDVVIDMYCYRRHGHNEGDEPLFTQPDLYKEIAAHPSAGQLFAKKLIATGVLTQADSDEIERQYESKLEAALEEVKQAEQAPKKAKAVFSESTAVFQPKYSHAPVKTAVSRGAHRADRAGDHAGAGGLRRAAEDQADAARQARAGFRERRPVRLVLRGDARVRFAAARRRARAPERAGQPARHLQPAPLGALRCEHARAPHPAAQSRARPGALLRLQQPALRGRRARVRLRLLAELSRDALPVGGAVRRLRQRRAGHHRPVHRLGGIEVAAAQRHGAAAAARLRGPGAGALQRAARTLPAARAEDNIQVCNLTTPAQYFHVLRRQMKRKFRKPLIIMTPKSLLRAEQCVSTLDDFTQGRFKEILPAPLLAPPEKIERVILCSGKIYYELLAHREKNKLTNVAIIRVEQLYPLDETALRATIEQFPPAAQLVWCQEESQNMGAWTHVYLILDRMFDRPVWCASRNASASTAVGSLAIHKREQKVVIQDAFNL